jgi:hypothetical protein
VAPRTNPIRSASPPAAPHRCGRYSAQTCGAEDQVSSLRARTFPTTRICPHWPAYETNTRRPMIFNDECKVVNDPLKGTLGVSQHAADVSREPVECAPFRGQLRPRSRLGLPIVSFPSDHGRSGTHCGPEVLVLYLKRPRAKSWELRRCKGALQIQRLEGSRPAGLWDLYLDEPALIVCEFAGAVRALGFR